MFEKIFYKIGLTYSKFHFRKSTDEINRFTNFIQECKKILIILPNAPEQFDNVKDIIIGLHDTWREKQITVIVRSQFTAFNEFKEFFQTLGISNNDINRFFLPRKKFIQEVKINEYDLIIDLNIDFYLLASFLTGKLNSKYRIGIKKNYGDLFYNFQFNPVEYHNYKNIYNKLFKNLFMFGNIGEKNEIQSRKKE